MTSHPVSSLQCPQMREVNVRLSGEKARASDLRDVSCENSKHWSRWSVAESRIFNDVACVKLTAMKLLHCDHATRWFPEGIVADAASEFDNTDTPCATLAKGWACDSYSLRTIESLGVRTRAE